MSSTKRNGSSALAASFLFVLTCLTCHSQAQEVNRDLSNSSSALCNTESSVELIQQQIGNARVINDLPDRIKVMVFAANLLWPYQNNIARKTFADAFEFAKQDYKEAGDKEVKLAVGLSMEREDLRFTVIGAVAKRDPEWGRKLTTQLLDEKEQATKDGVQRDQMQDVRTAERLLNVASFLLPADPITASSFARLSLRYPATVHLPIFLYRFAASNKPAADTIYAEAVAAYANAPMDRFLFLSAYPFGGTRDVGETPGHTLYRVPDGYTSNKELQRLFLQALLRRAHRLLTSSGEQKGLSRIPEPGQIWMALTALEKEIATVAPEMVPVADEARRAALGLLTSQIQRLTDQLVSSRNTPRSTFKEQVEAGEKQANVDYRDRVFAFAVMNSREVEDFDEVLEVVGKISDSTVRKQLRNWAYFDRSTRAILNDELVEARNLASQVDELAERAYLYSRIAEARLKKGLDATESREMLEEVIAAALRATPSMVSVRTLLNAAYLYTKLDVNRPIGVLADALKQLNQLESPDLSLQFVTRKIEGKTFVSYAHFSTPGFTPENAILEIAKADFDGTLSQISSIQNRALRATSTLSLMGPCLKVRAPEQPNPGHNRKL